MSLSLKLFDKGYLGTRPGKPDDPLPIGYLVPFGTDSATKRKIALVDDWVMEEQPAIVIDNTPSYGFKLSKSTRLGNVNDNTVNIEDPRGFDLEISMANFVIIVSNSLIVNGEIKNECVWAVDGSAIVLLTTDSDRYKQARENTDRFAASVNTRTVKPGNKILLQNGKIATYYGQVYTVEKESTTQFDDNTTTHYGWRNSRPTKCTVRHYIETSKKKKHFLVYEGDENKYELLSTLKTSSILDDKTLSSAEVQTKLFTFKKSNYFNCDTFKFCFVVDKDPKISLELVKGDFNTLFPIHHASTRYRNSMFYIKTKSGETVLSKGSDIQHTISYMSSNRQGCPTIDGVLFDDIDQLKTGEFEIKRDDYYNASKDSKCIEFDITDIDEIYEIIVIIESAGVQGKGSF